MSMINESSQHRSPMNELPIEILCEIFSRCIDQSSARVLMQPNTKIAPMLLCQVCATWRAAVLSIPLFWSHLRFELPITWHSNGRPFTWDPELFRRRLEWLRWWRRNLASMAPYLQVELQQKNSSHYRPGRLSKTACEFLLEFMSSAQYISVGRLYQYLVQRRRRDGYMVGVHPNAHTVVATWSYISEFDDLYTHTEYLLSIFALPHSILRYITIEDSSNLRTWIFTNPRRWSTLTHLSMDDMAVNLTTWFSFIRSLSALQWGTFHLSLTDRDIDTYIRPSVGSLTCLTVFNISASQDRIGAVPNLLKAVFDNLQLPALRTLSLEPRMKGWYDFTDITDIHAALTSAPAITKLSLVISFPDDNADYSTELSRQARFRSDIEPLATVAPQLEHLSITMRSPLRWHGGFQLVDKIFASSCWLDLKNPASTIREVTLVSSGKLGLDNSVAELHDRSLLVLEVRKFVKDEVIVKFEDEEPVEMRRAVWGW